MTIKNENIKIRRYFDILLRETYEIEQNFKILEENKTIIIDPNYHLLEGQLQSLISVVTDMSKILDIPIEHDFYVYAKENIGFLDLKK